MNNISLAGMDSTPPRHFRHDRGSAATGTTAGSPPDRIAARRALDLLVVVPDEQLHAAVPAFCGIGYLRVPESFADDPQHLFFHRLRAGKRTHHLHVVAASSHLVARYLVFRDYLRSHSDEARRYATRERPGNAARAWGSGEAAVTWPRRGWPWVMVEG